MMGVLFEGNKNKVRTFNVESVQFRTLIELKQSCMLNSSLFPTVFSFCYDENKRKEK